MNVKFDAFSAANEIEKYAKDTERSWNQRGFIHINEKSCQVEYIPRALERSGSIPQRLGAVMRNVLRDVASFFGFKGWGNKSVSVFLTSQNAKEPSSDSQISALNKFLKSLIEWPEYKKQAILDLSRELLATDDALLSEQGIRRIFSSSDVQKTLVDTQEILTENNVRSCISYVQALSKKQQIVGPLIKDLIEICFNCSREDSEPKSLLLALAIIAAYDAGLHHKIQDLVVSDPWRSKDDVERIMNGIDERMGKLNPHPTVDPMMRVVESVTITSADELPSMDRYNAAKTFILALGGTVPEDRAEQRAGKLGSVGERNITKNKPKPLSASL